MNIAIHRASTAPAGHRGQDLQDQLLGCLPVRAIAALAAPGGVRCRGPFWASAIGRWLQQALGVQPTGRINGTTLAALNKADPAILVKDIIDRRLTFLKRLQTWPTFHRGWESRLLKIRRLSQ